MLTFFKGLSDDFNNQKNRCVGIDWDHLPYGQHPGSGEFDCRNWNRGEGRLAEERIFDWDGHRGDSSVAHAFG